MAALSGFYTILLIIIGALLIVSGSLGINLHNRCDNSNTDTVSSGEQSYFIFVLVIGIIVILVPPFMYFV